MSRERAHPDSGGTARSVVMVVRNTIWLSVQPLLLNVLAIAATAYITRQLGAAKFGVFNVSLAFVALFAPLANLGLRPLVSRQVARQRDSAGVILGRVMVLRCGLSLVVAGLAILAAPIVGSPEARAPIAIMAVGMVATTAMQVLVDGFQAFEIVRPASIAQFIGGALLTLASVLAIWAGGGVRDLALAYAVGPLCTLALLWAWSLRMPFRPRLSWEPAAFQEMLRRALPFFGIIILGEASNRIDVVVIARLLGEANAGCYAAAMMIVDRATMIIDGAATALLPAVAHLSATSPTATAQLLRKSATWCLLISLPVAVLTTIFAPQAIGLIFGAKYATAVPILALGIWRLPAMSLAVVAGHALFATGQQTKELRTGAIAMLVSLALIYPLVRTFGPFGGAVGASILHLVAFLLRLPALSRCIPGLWDGRQLARVGAALACMCLPLAFVPALGQGLTTLALAPLAIGLYVAVLAALGVVPLQPILRQVRQRLVRTPGHFAWAAEAGETGKGGG